MCDLMPRFVHDALDKLECSLSLPVLGVVVLCTLQFAWKHFMNTACIMQDIMRKRAKRCPSRCPKPKKSGDGCCLFEWISACIASWFKKKCADKLPRKPKPICKRKCGKKRCAPKDKWDDDLFDEADDLLNIEDL